MNMYRTITLPFVAHTSSCVSATLNYTREKPNKGQIRHNESIGAETCGTPRVWNAPRQPSIPEILQHTYYRVEPQYQHPASPNLCSNHQTLKKQNL